MSATTLNLAAVLEHHARQTPNRLAVLCGPHHLTYAQLNGLACQVAGGLRQLGLVPGDHVVLSCPNTPHFPIAYFGLLKAGAVVVPINVLLKPREIAYHLKDSDAVAMMAFEGTPDLPLAQMARAACDEVPSCRHLIIMTVDPAAPCPVDRARTSGQLMSGQRSACDTHPSAADDTAVMLYTSGTTGQPKGAELTHLNMFVNALASRDMTLPLLGHTPEREVVSLITLPLFHSTGQTAQMTAGLAGGFTLALMPRFDPAAVIASFERDRVAVWVGVPTMFWALLQHATRHEVDVSRVAASLEVCVSGGAPMPPAVMREFEAAFGVRILEGYGLSETSPVVCLNQVYRPSKPGTVGQPVIACEVRVVDERDTPVRAGEAGEIVVRGHNVMKGYYKRPQETAEALRGGWFHTGDIGVIDGDGYLSIVDRKKDMVLRGGMNVYPREIEDLLMTHPAVSMAAVIGVPDERLGEEIKAFIVRRAGATVTADELIQWSKEQLAAYKYPRSIEFRESLPMGATGKVLKRALTGTE